MCVPEARPLSSNSAMATRGVGWWRKKKSWEGGVLAPEHSCSWQLTKIEKNSKTCQKNLKFFGDEHIHVFYISVKFREQIIIFLLCAKKTNSVTKMRSKKYVFRAEILSFLHRAAEMLFRHEIWHVCSKHVYVHHQTISEFFDRFYYFFRFYYLSRSIWARVSKWISVIILSFSSLKLI